MLTEEAKRLGIHNMSDRDRRALDKLKNEAAKLGIPCEGKSADQLAGDIKAAKAKL